MNCFVRRASFALIALLLVGCGDGGDGAGPVEGPVVSYTLTLSVSGDALIGALQLEIEHLGNSGGFIGRGDQVDCQPLVQALVAGNFAGEGLVRIGMISLQGIPSPTALLQCGFRTREEIVPGSFLVEVSDASDINSQPLDPYPEVFVSQVTIR